MGTAEPLQVETIIPLPILGTDNRDHLKNQYWSSRRSNIYFLEYPVLGGPYNNDESRKYSEHL